MATVTQIGPRPGIAPTCAALGLPRATYYRRRRPPRAAPPRRLSPRALGVVDGRTLPHESLQHDRAEPGTPNPRAEFTGRLDIRPAPACVKAVALEPTNNLVQGGTFRAP